MLLLALNGGDVQNFLHLHQLLAQSPLRRCSRRACVHALMICTCSGVGGKLNQTGIFLYASADK